jgi:lactate 2-monooxygenase
MTDGAARGDFGRGRQRAVFVAGVGGRRPAVPVDAARLEERARDAMSPEAFAYVAGGAGAEATLRANREAFDRWRILPRMLRDVSVRDLSTTLFGRRLDPPLLLAPIGVLEMAHPQADLAVARAAAAEGVPFVFSNQASVPMEDCAAAMGGAPRWFQLYWSRDDALVASFVRRAEACGCEAIVLTLDTTMLGWRTRDLDLAYLPFLRGMGIAQYASDPVFRASLASPLEDAGPEVKPAVNARSLGALGKMLRRWPGGVAAGLRSGEPRRAVQRFVATYSRPSLTWADLAYLRGLTRLPILLKGIQHPDDARLAVEHGMDGVIVSNHGGRRWTARWPPSTRCRAWWTPSPALCPCCSTAACGAARTRSRRWRWGRPPSASAGRTRTGWPSRARPACARSSPTSARSWTSRWASPAARRWRRSAATVSCVREMRDGRAGDAGRTSGRCGTDEREMRGGDAGMRCGGTDASLSRAAEMGTRALPAAGAGA